MGFKHHIISTNNLQVNDIFGGKNGQNDHLRPEQRDHPLAGAN